MPIVLLRFSIERMKKTKAADGTITKGSAIPVTGTSRIIIDEKLQSFFNIPAAAEGDALEQTEGQVTPKLIQVAGTTYDRTDIAGAVTAAGITRNKNTRQASDGGTGIETSKPASLFLPSQYKTKKGNPKIVQVGFPRFFTNLMISQALGTMITAKKPRYWASAAGRRYEILYGNGGQVIAGANAGAWVVNAEEAGTNLDNVDDVTSGSATITTRAGAGKAAATPQ